MKIICKNTRNIIVAVAFACLCLASAAPAEAACYWSWEVVRIEPCPTGKSLQLNRVVAPYPWSPLGWACLPCGGYACNGGGGGMPYGIFCANNSGIGGCEYPAPHPIYDWAWRCDGECQTFPSGINPLPSSRCLAGDSSTVSGNGTNGSPWTWTCVGTGPGHTDAPCTAKKPCVYDNYSCDRSGSDVICANTYPENCEKTLPVNKICSARDVNGTCSGVLSQSDCVAAGTPCANTTENCASCPLEPGRWREVSP